MLFSQNIMDPTSSPVIYLRTLHLPPHTNALKSPLPNIYAKTPPRHSMPAALATVTWNLFRLATVCAAPLSYVIFYPKILFQIYLNYFFHKKYCLFLFLVRHAKSQHTRSLQLPLGSNASLSPLLNTYAKPPPRHSMPVALATVAWNLPRLATVCAAPLSYVIFYSKVSFQIYLNYFFHKKTPCTAPASASTMVGEGAKLLEYKKRPTTTIPNHAH